LENDELITRIREGKNETEIFEMINPDLEKYKLLRKKYLLYSDFE
jgi:hypothetical protein